MNRIELSPENIHRGHLILVNEHYPLVFCCETRYVFAVRQYPDILLEQRAAAMLAHAFHALGIGDQIVPVSGYRTQAEQEQLYARSLTENGETFTRQYVALPGCSEHQTGLAVDLAQNRELIDPICPAFPYSGVCDRFRRAAPRYGFIERYPMDREGITGISHEPWHFRYIGYPHSQIVFDQGCTLEEYTAYCKAFPYDGPHLFRTLQGQTFEIFYVSCPDAPRVRLPLSALYQVSGNNVDGFVVTMWRGAL